MIVPDAPLSARSRSYAKPSSRPCGSIPGARPSWLQLKTTRKLVTGPSSNAVFSEQAAIEAERRAETEQLLQLCEQQQNLRPAGSRAFGQAEKATVSAPKANACEENGSGGAALPAISRTFLDETPSVHQPYRWTPVQRWQHGFVEGQYFLGTFVNTLSLNLQDAEIDWHDMDLPSQALEPRHLPRCCDLGSGFILCIGMVRAALQHNDSADGSTKILLARLPEGMRPPVALPFAALGQEVSGKVWHRGVEPQLVLLVVRPDGWIQCLSENAANSIVDLSAVRFSLARGVAISDEVRLHTCDTPTGRYVMLQGSLAERSFPVHSHSPLAHLPPACRHCPGLLASMLYLISQMNTSVCNMC
jgi:hypothetical protein